MRRLHTVVILVALISVSMLGCSSSDPTGSTTSAAPVDTTTTTIPADSSAMSGLPSDWQMITLPTDRVSELFDGDIEGIGSEWLSAMPDGRLYVLGWAATFEHEEAALVWTSTDGEDWERIDVGEGLVFIEGIAPSETGYLAKAVSRDGDTDDEAANYRIEYWASDDGAQWTLLAGAPVEDAASHELERYFTPEYLFEAVTDSWLSVEPPPGGCLGAHDHLVDADGTTTAICRDTDGNVMTDEPVAFWALGDDGAWAPLDLQPSLEDEYGEPGPVTKVEFGEVNDIGGVFMTVPNEEGFWVSATGRAWRFVDVDPAMFPPGSSTQTMTVVDDRLIVVGASADSTPVIWIAQLS